MTATLLNLPITLWVGGATLLRPPIVLYNGKRNALSTSMDELVFGAQTDPFPDSFSGDTGSIGYLFGANAKDVRELFATPVDVAEGSVITVIEELFIELTIKDEKLVDLDAGWFGGRPYLGTYRLASEEQFLLLYVNPEDEGFITSVNFYIRRETPYAVVSDRQGILKDFGKVVLDRCTFALVPSLLVAPPPALPVPTAGFRLADPLSVFRGAISSSFFPLGAGKIKRKINAVGLFLKPGVEFATGRRITRIGGQVETIRPPIIANEVCGLESDECALKESQFFSNENGIFRTFGEAYQFILDNSDPGATGLAEALQVGSITVDLGDGCIVQAYGQAGGLG